MTRWRLFCSSRATIATVLTSQYKLSQLLLLVTTFTTQRAARLTLSRNSCILIITSCRDLFFFISDDSWQDHRFKPLRLAMAAGPDTFKRWLTLAEEDPFESVETCLCEIVIERGVWISDSTYGNYAQHRWFMESFAHVDVERCVFTPKQIVIFPPLPVAPLVDTTLLLSGGSRTQLFWSLRGPYVLTLARCISHF